MAAGRLRRRLRHVQGLPNQGKEIDWTIEDWAEYIQEATIKEKETMTYLGGLLAADGRMSSELARRLGAAAADFKQLQVVWGHANVSRSFMVIVYKTCVVQKLMYCLHTGCFTKA